MHKIRVLSVLAFCVAGSLMSPNASATILTFNTITGAFYQEYGDRVTSTTSGGFSYEQGSGFTPNVVVSYLPLSTSTPFSIYSGYYGLSNALGHSNFDVAGEIVLTPDAGFNVILESLQAGGWWNTPTDWLGQYRIWDDNGSFSAPNIASGTWNLAPTASPAGITLGIFAAATGSVHMYFDNLGTIGVDNISFSQVAAVPVPAAVWMLLSGLAGLGGVARRRRAD